MFLYDQNVRITFKEQILLFFYVTNFIVTLKRKLGLEIVRININITVQF